MSDYQHFKYCVMLYYISFMWIIYIYTNMYEDQATTNKNINIQVIDQHKSSKV